MNLLLDTHVLLWWLDDNRTLSAKARKAIGEGGNLVFISAVSAWEIAIKKKLGKLRAPDDLEGEITRHRFQHLPITIAHALAVGKLPDHHADPFDRMLVAQAQVEGLTLISRDTRINKYRIHILEA